MNRSLLLWSALVLAALPVMAARAEEPDESPLVLRNLLKPDVAPSYLIICPQKAVAEVLPLATYRHEHGHTVRIATLETVREAFADADRGAVLRSSDPHNPENRPAREIRAFVDSVRKAAPQGSPLQFLLLVGTGDERNANGMHLPTAVVPACYPRHPEGPPKKLCGDHLYGVAPGHTVPNVAVGRFPARSLGQVRIMVEKTLAYETGRRPGTWRRCVQMVAGQSYYHPVADRMIEILARLILGAAVPDYLSLDFTYANPRSPYCYAPALFGDHLVDVLGQGPAMFVYVGHGNADFFSGFQWRGRWYNVFGPAPARRVRNPGHRTLAVAIACSTGAFTRESPAICEQMVVSADGPAMVIAASADSEPYGNAVLADLVVQEMVNAQPATVGEGLLAIRRSLVENRQTLLRRAMDLMAATQLGLAALPRQRMDQLAMYNLFGDPAATFPLVGDAADLAAPDEAPPGAEITVTLRGPVPAGTAHFSLTIRRGRMIGEVVAVPEDHPKAEQEMIRTHAAANRKALAEARVPITDGKAQWTVRVPADCDEDVLFANVYAEGATTDAAATRTVRILSPKDNEKAGE